MPLFTEEGQDLLRQMAMFGGGGPSARQIVPIGSATVGNGDNAGPAPIDGYPLANRRQQRRHNIPLAKRRPGQPVRRPR
jgi:hypothetical protein